MLCGALECGIISRVGINRGIENGIYPLAFTNGAKTRILLEEFVTLKCYHVDGADVRV